MEEGKGAKDPSLLYLLVCLTEGALLDRLADVFAATREEPGAARSVVHDEDLARGRLDDDHACAQDKVVRPEAAVRNRRRRVLRVEPGFPWENSCRRRCGAAGKTARHCLFVWLLVVGQSVGEKEEGFSKNQKMTAKRGVMRVVRY